MALGGNKNSPETATTTASTTKNTQIGGAVTAGANSQIGGAVTLSDITGVAGPIRISTTDQGAVNAGLQLGLRALDTSNLENMTALQTASGAVDSAVGVATTVAQGQQNTSLKYILYGVVALAAAGVLYAYLRGK